MKKIVKSICTQCHCECGVLVHVEDGVVKKIEGDPEFPQNEGTMCPKGLAFVQLLYHPDRLKYPMKRVGEKGEGKWERISWEEALDLMAAKFTEYREKYGPQSIAFGFCDGDRDEVGPWMAWLIAVGSPYIFGTDAHYCLRPAFVADSLTFGQSHTWEVGPDYDNSNCILIWGANPVESHPCSTARRILKARARGAKLIVVDPRFTPLASKADVWLQPRPATDAAVALGMLNVIINEKLYDEDFVKNWCTGFEELKERVQQYPPSKVAEISWVPEEDLVKAARLYAKNKPCAFHTRMGLLMNTNNLQTVRAVDLLSAVTGNVDIKGSNILPYPSPPRSRSYVDFFRLHKESIPLELFETRPGYKEWPLIYGYDSPWNDAHPPSAIEAIARGQVKAMIWVNDPVMGLQNSKKIQESLKKLEFMVGIDFFLSPTANLADIVLPSATWLERDMIHDLHYFYLPPKGKRDYHESFVSIGEKVIEPLYECWEERKMAAELIKRMGLKSPIPIDSSDAYNNWRLEPLGITVDELKKKRIVSIPIKYKKYEEIGFQTPSFNVELCSNVLKEQGFDPLPYYEEPPESPYSTPELAKEYPFILISGGRHICFYHGALRQLPWLRELNPEPKVEINPETAEELGIRNGDWVWIETPRRKGERVKLKAELTETVHPKVIHAYSHWWFPERKDDPDRGCFESNINIITYDDPPYDKHSGTPLIRGCLCKIGKVEA